MANKFNPAELDLQEQLVALNRVSKTVKGGRIARFAAAELNAHIEKITGPALPVVTAPQAGKTNIYVGASKYTPGNKTFALEEYMIKVKGNDIFLRKCISAIHINRVRHRLERIKRDTDR